jgi:hypothetical protein
MSVKPYSSIKSAEELTRSGYVYNALTYLDNLLKNTELPDCEGDQIKNIAPFNIRKSSLNVGNLIIEVNQLESEGQFRGSVPIYWRNNAGVLELTTDSAAGPWVALGEMALKPWEDYALDVQGAIAEAAASVDVASSTDMFAAGPFTAWALVKYPSGVYTNTPLLRHTRESDGVVMEFGVDDTNHLYLICDSGTYQSDGQLSDYDSFEREDRFLEVGFCADPMGGPSLYFFISGVVESDQAVSTTYLHGTEEHIEIAPDAGAACALAAIGVLPGLLYLPDTQHFPSVRKPAAPLSFEYWHFRDVSAGVIPDMGIYDLDTTLNTGKAAIVTEGL